MMIADPPCNKGVIDDEMDMIAMRWRISGKMF